MKKLILFAFVMFVSSGVALAQLRSPGQDNTPAVGSVAPDFGLDELQGQTKALLAFFPAAFTPG